MNWNSLEWPSPIFQSSLFSEVIVAPFLLLFIVAHARFKMLKAVNCTIYKDKHWITVLYTIVCASNEFSQILISLWLLASPFILFVIRYFCFHCYWHFASEIIFFFGFWIFKNWIFLLFWLNFQFPSLAILIICLLGHLFMK